MHGNIPKDEICGVLVGHVWYYFNDIYPPTHGGHRPMDPPQWWINLFEGNIFGRANANEAEDVADTQAQNLQREFAAAAAPDVH